MMPTEDIYQPLLNVIEFLGTFAFAISGIRHAAAKRFDWFGGFMQAFIFCMLTMMFISTAAE